MKSELLAIGWSLVNLYLESLSFPLYLFTLADLASQFEINDLSLSITLIARHGALTIHAWSHLPHNSTHTTTLTCWASLHSRSIGSTKTITSFANSLSVNTKIEWVSIIHVVESALNSSSYWLNAGFSLLGSATGTSTTHEHGEDVIHTTSASSGSFFNSIHTVLVIHIPFFFVREDFVSTWDFFELYKKLVFRE